MVGWSSVVGNAVDSINIYSAHTYHERVIVAGKWLKFISWFYLYKIVVVEDAVVAVDSCIILSNHRKANKLLVGGVDGDDVIE